MVRPGQQSRSGSTTGLFHTEPARKRAWTEGIKDTETLKIGENPRHSASIRVPIGAVDARIARPDFCPSYTPGVWGIEFACGLRVEA